MPRPPAPVKEVYQREDDPSGNRYGRFRIDVFASSCEFSSQESSATDRTPTAQLSSKSQARRYESARIHEMSFTTAHDAAYFANRVRRRGIEAAIREDLY
jgi:hypothetical protein